MSEKLIVHRSFEGEHEMSDSCWCRPIEVDADDLRDTDEILRETEASDG